MWSSVTYHPKTEKKYQQLKESKGVPEITSDDIKNGIKDHVH